ncbi:ABC transporter ATP-binding protein [Listeria cossartiae subsp. cayugensis]|uniref:ABC transporter ATP-binding protein n=1 Tax=Listeria cossartiae TaxID=2838249 RepID=UPI0028804BB4|nr:ABC transporter ATP-binding protein [Listeria cossartiae]MDS9999274.1 ABC transporter ATP-binding protein [Listeria cossartiae subsp. cayugensis]MDT0008279.1 ABC transporter ATP-binding protein [Listeria cossartiae subsp. cayugensis]MDT0029306.1 ABC transporter ATP-binding protein [Listeria cossartiae subsp. cayugensis]MDT0037421.1 ABC transporter ATP-binding protein [Listeria cossartiae subsp. cayugensis]MDT0042771.1 ABC transporter ATP-binding protein [Listeria cossartiae subsp. cayugensi
MLKRFFSYYKPYRTLFIIDFGCAVLAAILELAFPVAVNHVIDTLLPGKDFGLIITAALALLFFYILNTFMQYIVTYFGHMLGLNIETDMRRDLFSHLQKQPFGFYDNQKTGKLMSRMTTDLFEIGEVAHHGPEDIFISIMSLFGAFFLMLNINVKLAISTFILVPILTVLIVYFNKRMTKVTTGIFKDLGNFNAGVENAISGVRVVQAFANEPHEKGRFRVLNQAYRQSKLMFYKVMGLSFSFNYFLMRLISLFALLFGAYFTINGEISYGEFVGFILLTNVFIRPIEKINNVIESYPKGFAGFKRFLEVMDTEPAIQDEKDAKPAGEFRGDIHYNQVSFEYSDGKNVLNHINLSIKAGETVAFVGPSGAGKTTICNLLPRFYEVSDGEITIDGENIKRFTLPSLRAQIGVVQQDVFLFSGTVRENIAYGKLDASEEEIEHVVKLAHLSKVVEEMPDGLDTIIGERGVKLSGGQKQRLAIARMFLKNPPILILDEATSALDTETEQVIQASLEELAEGRTTLIIAHRLATIKHADRIIVVNETGIAETGTHEELLARENGAYKRLYDAQFNTI